MESRFSYDQPWNFGYSPSEYFQTLEKAQRTLFNFRYLSWKNMDEFHQLATSAPPTRDYSATDLEGIETFTGSRYECFLVASHCKPLGSFYVNQREKNIVRNLNIGLHVSISREKPIPWADDLILGYSIDIVELYLEMRLKIKDKKLSSHERVLVEGILFGYLIADVFGFAIDYTKAKTNNSSLIHSTFNELWSKEWTRNIGERGLEHLAKVYESRAV